MTEALSIPAKTATTKASPASASTSATGRGRAFVLDPVCAQPFGHNVVGLKYFSDRVGRFFASTTPVACDLLPADLAEQYGFKRDFGYYYETVMPLGHVRHGKAKRTLPMIERAATEDAARFLSSHQIGGTDAIVFPCVDFFGLVGMLNALRGVPAAGLPRLYVRFIGVLEGATTTAADGLGIVRQKLQQAVDAGLKVRLSAETPKYADHLAVYFGMPVDLVPYPVHAEVSPMPDPRGTFTVLCPGSSRYDKGYLMLREIFAGVRRVDPALHIRFKLQGLPPKQAVEHSKYTNQLTAIPGVQMLPSSISEKEMNSLYDDANLVLLPYDPATYRLRGSAVLMESISRGRPVLALAGSAFCDQVQYYNTGRVVGSAAEFVREIVRFFETSPEDVSEQCAQARYRFLIDSENAFDRWLSA